MIGKLRGVIDEYGEDFVVIDVGGVGYVAHCPVRTLQALPARGEPATLFIETHVREDAIRLFGFLTSAERDWFRLLQSVQGVGAKVALAILGALSATEMASALASGDKAMVARAPGVGPRLAQRIVAELKDKAPAFAPIDPNIARLSGGEEESAPQPARDAISALVNLGYGRPQAVAAVGASLSALGDSADCSMLIRRGLKELAS